MPRLIDSSSLSLNYRGDEDYPLLITPDIFRRIGFRNLPRTENPIVFFGFDINHPLYLPKNHTFDGDVWVVGCIFNGMQGVTFNKSLNLLQTRLDISESTANYRGTRSMDEESYQSYRDCKIKYHINDNRSLILNSDEKQLERLIAVMKQCPLYDFKAEYNDTVVTEPVELRGPYPFAVSKDTVFKEKVSVIDIFNQTFHREVTFEKELFILGIY